MWHPSAGYNGKVCSPLLNPHGKYLQDGMGLTQICKGLPDLSLKGLIHRLERY